MKKLIIMVLFLFFLQLTSFAKNSVNLIIENTAAKKAVIIPEKNEYTKLATGNFMFAEYVLTCGNTVQYFPPSGESCTNIMNALININNAVCGTSIPQIGAIFCGPILP